MAMEHNYNKNMDSLLITYDCANQSFTYPASADAQFGVTFDGRPLWEILEAGRNIDSEKAEVLKERILGLAARKTPQVSFAECFVKDADGEKRRCRIGFMCPFPGNYIHISFTDIEDEFPSEQENRDAAQIDELTGLLTRKAFYNAVKNVLEHDKAGVAAGEYAIMHLNVIRFKAINDIFGLEAGDRVLRFIAELTKDILKGNDVACRTDADRFILFTHTSGEELEQLIEDFLEKLTHYQLPFEIACNIGIYVTTSEELPVDAMLDRAILAQSIIKGSYTKKYNYYTEALRKEMLGELEIVGMMGPALEERHFVVYYQPQYSHSTGLLVGAEALVRWKHPERGLISPGVFIPIFEKNGFISQLDLYVFEEVCAFIRRSLDRNYQVVPISSNFSKYDIYMPDFVEKLEVIRKKYDVPVKYLRIEITESAAVDNPKYTNEIIRKLHDCGYIVEMDDFGSGYSSLNVLKDIELDMIKLDMLFLSQDAESNRGGTILGSIVRMAKWLGMPVIAEGVEHLEQADFLRSIGCDCIQGYLYSKPLAEEDYEAKLCSDAVGTTDIEFIDVLKAYDFWDPKSQESLLFSDYVGGAAVFDYHDGQVEILRVNPKYLLELGMNLSEKDLIETNPWTYMDEENRQIYEDMLQRAIETGKEQESETWRSITSPCCGIETICIRSTVRMIGQSEGSYLFYTMIRNITNEKHYQEELSAGDKRFKMTSEQVKIYSWEYTVATREMRPCFRCMRDLGLPALVPNYPEPAIEKGIFPPEVADLFRDWHVQIANGVKELEAIMPLTEQRVLFRVRYTTEFDEFGHPIKAYGAATPIADEKISDKE